MCLCSKKILHIFKLYRLAFIPFTIVVIHFCSLFLSCNLPIFSFTARGSILIPKIPPKQYGKLLESSASRELNIDDFIKHLLVGPNESVVCVCALCKFRWPLRRGACARAHCNSISLTLFEVRWLLTGWGGHYNGIFWV